MGSVGARLPIGERLLCSLVDEYAQYEPDKLVASYPTSAEMNSWHDVTYAELSRAVNSLAWHIEETAGRGSGSEVIGYMGNNDMRYPAFWLAAVKCGYATLNTSPRNSVEGQLSLLKETGCSKFFYSQHFTKPINAMTTAASVGFQTFLIPSYDDLLQSPKANETYPFSKTFKELADTPALIFHTSGSSGLPKAVSLSHRYYACMDNVNVLQVPEGRKLANWHVMKPGDKFFNSFPMFHHTGSILTFVAPVFCGIVCVLQSTDIPLNEDSVAKITERGDLVATWLPPSILEDISNSPEHLKALAKFDYIFTGGGPLSVPAGDRISASSNLIQMMGSTEMGLAPNLITKSWKYFEWNPYSRIGFEAHDDHGLYEMVIKRDPLVAKYQSIFCTFPDIQEWRTKDLFVQEAGHPELWTFAGRTDDVIVLSNGEKYNPISMEGHIMDHPLLKAAIVVGQGRFQCGLIVEPDYTIWDADNSPEDLIDHIWATVQEANKFSAATGRIFKSRIMVASKDKPFARAPKGTILRAPTIQLYLMEVDALYAGTSEDDYVPLPETGDIEAVKATVRKTLVRLFSLDDLQDTQDFFAAGMDSLQIMSLTNALSAALTARTKSSTSESLTLTPKAIYANSSVNKLALYLQSLLLQSTNNKQADTLEKVRSRQDSITSVVEKYTSGLPARIGAGKGSLNVILTGSTGSLGHYILHFLQSNPQVSTITCFNRSADGLERTRSSLVEKGLLNDLEERVTFLRVQFGHKTFGLEDAQYQKLLDNTDLIIHNAWAVNFNHSLDSFEDPHIAGVRNFIDLSVHSKHGAHIVFISSIGAIGGWTPPHANGADQEIRVPEIAMPDCDAAVPMGYAESKHISERILQAAADRVGVPSSIIRVGQVAGPTTEKGKWNDAEWLPTLVKTSKALGKVPNSLGGLQDMGIDWTPVDCMAAACVELALSRLQVQQVKLIDYFHTVNPQLADWSDLVPAIITFYAEQGVKLEMVSYEDWVDSLKKVAQSAPSAAVMKQMPGIALLDFFDGSQGAKRVRPGTTNAEATSPTIASLKPIDSKLMTTWLKQWSY